MPGCYYLIRKEVVEQVGLFDPRYFLYYEEVDHCFAAKKAGWDITSFPDTTVMHIGGESAKTDNTISSVSRQISALQIESELLYFRKNHGILGVLLHLLLMMVTELIALFKRAIKSKLNINNTFDLKPFTLFCKLCWQTKFGYKPIH